MSLSIRLHSIRCLDEKNEASAAEEPYVLVTATDLKPGAPGLPAVPNVRIFRYGIWEDFDEGETVVDGGPPFWGLDTSPADIASPGDVGFVVSLLENDNAQPGQYQALVEAVATTSLLATLGEPNRAERVRRLAESIRRALDGVELPFPFALDDDHVGTVELPLDQGDLVPSGTRDKVLRIASGEGDYELTFRISRVGGAQGLAGAQALAGAPRQPGWRFCGKCMAMFFDGFAEKGSCPAGGGHQAAGLEFVLVHDAPPASNVQSAWRFCGKCMALFFDGFPEKGVCAAGGGHEAAGFVFSLPHDLPPGPNEQGDWRFCGRCMAQFFDGFPENGVCAAGGGHEASGFTFVLTHL